nr:PH19-63 [Vibrio phage 1]
MPTLAGIHETYGGGTSPSSLGCKLSSTCRGVIFRKSCSFHRPDLRLLTAKLTAAIPVRFASRV